jgi:hypothetical protein
VVAVGFVILDRLSRRWVECLTVVEGNYDDAPLAAESAARDGARTESGGATDDDAAARPDDPGVPPVPPPDCPTLPGGPTSDLQAYLTRFARCHWAARAARIAALSTPAKVYDRQAYVRARLLEQIGGFPAKTDLNARIVPPAIAHDGYRMEKVIYESQPQFYVTANLYLPTDPKFGPGPYPAVLVAAGHGSGG